MTSLDKNLNAGNKRFSFASKAYPADKFSVVKMEGYEAISANFSFELTLVSDDASIDFEKMLSNPATFTLYAAGGNMDTPYHGVLSEFEQLHQTGDLVFYRAVLAPRFQRLKLYRTSDVYLNDQTIPEILEEVIKDSKEAGLTSADYEKKLRGSYRKRSFVCQYQETNLDFMMAGAALGGAVLDNADFSGIKAAGANFGRASAKGARFDKADLSGADFTGANLHKGSLRKATTERTLLRKANLYGVDFYDTTPTIASLEGSNIDQTILQVRKPVV